MLVQTKKQCLDLFREAMKEVFLAKRERERGEKERERERGREGETRMKKESDVGSRKDDHTSLPPGKC